MSNYDSLQSKIHFDTLFTLNLMDESEFYPWNENHLTPLDQIIPAQNNILLDDLQQIILVLLYKGYYKGITMEDWLKQDIDLLKEGLWQNFDTSSINWTNVVELNTWQNIYTSEEGKENLFVFTEITDKLMRDIRVIIETLCLAYGRDIEEVIYNAGYNSSNWTDANSWEFTYPYDTEKYEENLLLLRNKNVYDRQFQELRNICELLVDDFWCHGWEEQGAYNPPDHSKYQIGQLKRNIFDNTYMALDSYNSISGENYKIYNDVYPYFFLRSATNKIYQSNIIKNLYNYSNTNTFKSLNYFAVVDCYYRTMSIFEKEDLIKNQEMALVDVISFSAPETGIATLRYLHDVAWDYINKCFWTIWTATTSWQIDYSTYIVKYNSDGILISTHEIISGAGTRGLCGTGIDIILPDSNYERDDYTLALTIGSANDSGSGYTDFRLKGGLFDFSGNLVSSDIWDLQGTFKYSYSTIREGMQWFYDYQSKCMINYFAHYRTVNYYRFRTNYLESIRTQYSPKDENGYKMRRYWQGGGLEWAHGFIGMG